MNIKLFRGLVLLVVLPNYLSGCSDCGSITDDGIRCVETTDNSGNDTESKELRRCCGH